MAGGNWNEVAGGETKWSSYLKNKISYPFLPESWKWKMAPLGDKPVIFQVTIFHFHEYGRKGIHCAGSLSSNQFNDVLWYAVIALDTAQVLAIFGMCLYWIHLDPMTKEREDVFRKRPYLVRS